MPLYQFTCKEGHTTEKRVRHYDVTVVPCSCGLNAIRASVNRINFGGYASTKLGEAVDHNDYRRFTEASAELDYTATKYESEGAEVKTPSMFLEAKKVAPKLAAAGVTADQIRT